MWRMEEQSRVNSMFKRCGHLLNSYVQTMLIESLFKYLPVHILQGNIRTPD